MIVGLSQYITTNGVVSSCNQLIGGKSLYAILSPYRNILRSYPLVVIKRLRGAILALTALF